MTLLVSVLTLLPRLIEIIEQWVLIAEADGVSGEEKKQIVVDAVKETLGFVVMIPSVGKMLPVKLIEPLIGPLIDVTVRIMNLVGKLPKKKNESKEG